MTQMIKEISLYTDGACSGNPGPGGWAAVLAYKGRENHLSGGLAHTTNNQMELLAVISGLEALKERCRVTIVTDSTYVIKAFEDKWINGWIRRGWKNSKGDPVANKELWQRLIPLVEAHTVSWQWVKGHNGHRFNELCDALAVAARDHAARQM